MTKEEAHTYIEKLRADYSKDSKTSKITAYNYWAQVERVVDGDTLDIRVDLGFKVAVRETFRLLGVDTPEKYGIKKTSEEYVRGVAASAFVENLIKKDDWIEIEVYTGKQEKYGRWLCHAYVNGKSLNEMLLAEGHAVPMNY